MVIIIIIIITCSSSSIIIFIYLFIYLFVCLFVLLQWISLTLSSGLIRCVAFGPRAVLLFLYRRMTYEALGAIFNKKISLKTQYFSSET